MVNLTMTTGSEYLSEENEQGVGKPGWYLPVNWSDNDGDGWVPGPMKLGENTPPTPANGPNYTPDKDDPLIVGGDRDLFEFFMTFELSVINPNQAPNGDAKLTFDSSKIRVWRSNDKSQGEVTSGTLFNYYDDFGPNAALPLFAEGIAGSATFKDAYINVEAVNLVNAFPAVPGSDNVEVTVFEITNKGKYGPGDKSKDNDFDFSSKDWLVSDNKLGIISYDTDQKCEFFHNCMEMQGTVKPAVVVGSAMPYGLEVGPYDPFDVVDFNAYRWRYKASWTKNSNDTWTLNQELPNHVWSDDSSINADNDRTVSSDSHIYFSDGPGFNINQTNGAKEKRQFADFINIFSGFIYNNEYQISGFAKWHSQTFLIANPADPTKFIRNGAGNQKLGDGWIDIPTDAPQ